MNDYEFCPCFLYDQFFGKSHSHYKIGVAQLDTACWATLGTAG